MAMSGTVVSVADKSRPGLGVDPWDRFHRQSATGCDVDGDNLRRSAGIRHSQSPRLSLDGVAAGRTGGAPNRLNQ